MLHLSYTSHQKKYTNFNVNKGDTHKQKSNWIQTHSFVNGRQQDFLKLEVDHKLLYKLWTTSICLENGERPQIHLH